MYEYARVPAPDLYYDRLRRQMLFRDRVGRGKEETDENHLASYPRNTEGHLILENQPLAEISKTKSRSSPQAIISSC